jgi:two-component system response regulator HydG
MESTRPTQNESLKNPAQDSSKASKEDKRFNQLNLIHSLSSQLIDLKNVGEFYRKAAHLIKDKLNYYHVSIWTLDPEKEISLMAQSGALEYRKTLQPGFILPKGMGIIGKVVETKRPMLSNDVSKDPNFTSLEMKSNTKSELCVPIFSPQRELLGTINIESNQLQAFDAYDVETMETIAHQVGLALRNSELYSEITQFNTKLAKTVEDKTQELKSAHAKIMDQQKMLRKENRALRQLVKSKKNSRIVGSSPAIESLMSMVDKIAPTQATVLIQGESGTGKELVAETLHEKSTRGSKPYVTINCGALQESLLESELFGHEKGAFTGAHAQKIGLAETADGGTLFLDEIGELSLGIQAKLLRFLQEGEICRVGGKKALQVDVRVISATNRDLEQEVKNGRFREDLFYRLNTITLRMPPLRKRKEDIPKLVDYFLSNTSVGGVVVEKKFTDEALTALTEYEWPGNIRELQNTIERLKILSESDLIEEEDIPFNIRSPQSRGELFEFHQDMKLQEVEKRHILRTLNHHKGNKTRAAQALGITIKTLYNKLHAYGAMEEKGA